MKPINYLITEAKKLNFTIDNHLSTYCLSINAEVFSGRGFYSPHNSISLTIYSDKTTDKLHTSGSCGINNTVKVGMLHIKKMYETIDRMCKFREDNREKIEKIFEDNKKRLGV